MNSDNTIWMMQLFINMVLSKLQRQNMPLQKAVAVVGLAKHVTLIETTIQILTHQPSTFSSITIIIMITISN